MDALLIALVAGLMVEVGARTQMAAHGLAAHFQSTRTVILALLGVTVVSLTLAAIAGLLVAQPMNPYARNLMMGLALAFGGFGQLRRMKPLPDLTGKRTLPTSILQLGSAHIADGSPFIAFAIAARSENAFLTVLGSGIAVLALCLPSILIPQESHKPAILLRLRRIGAAVLIVWGVWTILAALQLI